MNNYGVVKRCFWALFLVVGFAVCVSCAEAKQVVSLCDEQIEKLNDKQRTTLGLTKDQAICISTETITKNNEDLAAGFKFVFASNVHDLALSSSEIIDTFGHQKFTLIIDGMCSGKCSRLLMPLAEKIVFTENSFAALTDNSINSRGHYTRKHLSQKIKNNTVNVDEIKKLKTDYSNKISGAYSEDLEIVKLSAKSVTHLTWHSFVRQNLIRQIDRSCLPIDALAVILTSNYYKLNLISVKGRYKLPAEGYIINQVNQAMPGKPIIIYSYGKKPFSGCEKDK